LATDQPEPLPVDVLDSQEAGGRAIRGGLLRVAGYGGGLLASLAAAPFLIRHLGVTDFGGYVTVTSLVAIVAMVSDAGLTVVGIREYAARDDDARERLLRNLVALRLAISLLGAAGATAFALAAGYREELVVGTALAGLGVLLLAVQQAYTVPLNAQLRLGLVTALDLARQVLTAILIVAGVIVGAGLVAFLALPIGVGLVVLLATVVAVRGTIALSAGVDLAECRHLLRETLPVAVASTVGSFFYRAAILVMSVIAADDVIGYFSASFRLVEAALIVPGLIAAAAFPIVVRAAHRDADRLAYGQQRLFEIACILGAWTAICVAIGAAPAIDVLAGPDFEPSIPVLRIQAIALGVSFLVAVWAGGLWALRLHRPLTIANAAGVTGAALLVALLVPPLGAEGAAIAMSIAEVGLASAYGYALMHGRPHLRPSTAIVPRVGVAAALAIAVWLVPLPDAALVALATVVYGAALVALRAVPVEVWQALRDVRRLEGASAG
jgi:O-antigen/teichoic acid export membrane protein